MESEKGKCAINTGVKVWLKKERSFFGPGTAHLMREIEQLGSVREACRVMELSYSKGWTMIHAAEEQLGYQIVERSAGGKKGGSAVLSERGKELLHLYEEYESRVDQAAEEIYQEMIGDFEALRPE